MEIIGDLSTDSQQNGNQNEIRLARFGYYDISKAYKSLHYL